VAMRAFSLATISPLRVPSRRGRKQFVPPLWRQTAGLPKGCPQTGGRISARLSARFIRAAVCELRTFIRRNARTKPFGSQWFAQLSHSCRTTLTQLSHTRTSLRLAINFFQPRPQAKPAHKPPPLPALRPGLIRFHLNSNRTGAIIRPNPPAIHYSRQHLSLSAPEHHRPPLEPLLLCPQSAFERAAFRGFFS